MYGQIKLKELLEVIPMDVKFTLVGLDEETRYGTYTDMRDMPEHLDAYEVWRIDYLAEKHVEITIGDWRELGDWRE